jgi:hypothetical protein
VKDDEGFIMRRLEGAMAGCATSDESFCPTLLLVTLKPKRSEERGRESFCFSPSSSPSAAKGEQKEEWKWKEKEEAS